MGKKKRNLGRGLSALLGDAGEDYAELDKVRASKTVPVELLRPGKYQPRHRMDSEAIEELAQSIAKKGILQPLLVRRLPDDPNQYEIIAGERRWRAAQQARLHEVPVIIKDLDDSEALEVALIENLQRQDLSALEEAEGYQRLMEEFQHTQEQLAGVVGKSRSHVANTLRLLGLPEPVKQLLEQRKLTAGHARALLNAKDPEAVARKAVSDGLNVRQVELLVRKAAEPAKARKAAPAKDADTRALENDLTALLGLKVEIKLHQHGGALTIHYGTLEQLDDILQRLSHRPMAPAEPVDEDDSSYAYGDWPSDAEGDPTDRDYEQATTPRLKATLTAVGRGTPSGPDDDAGTEQDPDTAPEGSAAESGEPVMPPLNEILATEIGRGDEATSDEATSDEATSDEASADRASADGADEEPAPEGTHGDGTADETGAIGNTAKRGKAGNSGEAERARPARDESGGGWVAETDPLGDEPDSARGR